MDTTLIKKTFFTTLLLLYVFIFCPVAWCQLTENSVHAINPIPEILRTLIPEKQQIIMSGLADFAEKYKTSPNSIKKTFLPRSWRPARCWREKKMKQIINFLPQHEIL